MNKQKQKIDLESSIKIIEESRERIKMCIEQMKKIDRELQELI